MLTVGILGYFLILLLLSAYPSSPHSCPLLMMRLLLINRLPDHLLRLLKWIVASQAELGEQKKKLQEDDSTDQTIIQQIERIHAHLSVGGTKLYETKSAFIPLRIDLNNCLSFSRLLVVVWRRCVGRYFGVSNILSNQVSQHCNLASLPGATKNVSLTLTVHILASF